MFIVVIVVVVSSSLSREYFTFSVAFGRSCRYSESIVLVIVHIISIANCFNGTGFVVSPIIEHVTLTFSSSRNIPASAEVGMVKPNAAPLDKFSEFSLSTRPGIVTVRPSQESVIRSQVSIGLNSNALILSLINVLVGRPPPDCVSSSVNGTTCTRLNVAITNHFPPARTIDSL